MSQMLSISCTFDEELGPGGMDPLGKLVISNGDAEITIDTTYLDSWLGGLIEALRAMNTMNHVTVKTEEPKPIEIEKDSNGLLVISYDRTQLAGTNLRELESALRRAVGSFLSALQTSPEAFQNRLIDPIRQFWIASPN